jgi:predicted ABC-type transport system involved in lysophospholipase L1 biosynthesis ATPase subunit
MNRAAEPLLSLRGISKSYTLGGNTVHALRNVDLAVVRGEIAAITGPSGSGKSTLLNLCGLLDQADGGDMLYAGQPLLAADDAGKTLLRRQTIGFVFQSFNLVPVMNAHDNVEFPLYLLGVPAAERARSRQTAAARHRRRTHCQPGRAHRSANHRLDAGAGARTRHHLPRRHPRRPHAAPLRPRAAAGGRRAAGRRKGEASCSLNSNGCPWR